MAIFKYEAVDYTGKKVSGQIKAKDKLDVINILRKNRVLIISIEIEKDKIAGGFNKKGKISLKEIAVFSRQLSALIKAGIPLIKSLNILYNQIENRYFKEIISTMCINIESGKSFSEALSLHPDIFPFLYINMVKVGEMGGVLEEILERLTSYLEDSVKLARKVKSAFIYPVIVLSVAFLITASIFIFVIPNFKNIFDSLGAKLPLPTQIVIKISDIFRQYFWVFIPLTIILCFLLKKAVRIYRVSVILDNLKLRIPLFGKLMQKVIIARFSKTLATLLKSGISIVSALNTASMTSGNKTVELILNDVKIQVNKGEKIADSMPENSIFSPLVISLIAVGEETGDLTGMLEKIALFYEDEVDTMVGSLTSLLEPFIIVFLGVVIGGIVLSMFLPILQITQILGK